MIIDIDVGGSEAVAGKEWIDKTAFGKKWKWRI